MSKELGPNNSPLREGHNASNPTARTTACGLGSIRGQRPRPPKIPIERASGEPLSTRRTCRIRLTACSRLPQGSTFGPPSPGRRRRPPTAARRDGISCDDGRTRPAYSRMNEPAGPPFDGTFSLAAACISSLHSPDLGAQGPARLALETASPPVLAGLWLRTTNYLGALAASRRRCASRPAADSREGDALGAGAGRRRGRSPETTYDSTPARQSTNCPSSGSEEACPLVASTIWAIHESSSRASRVRGIPSFFRLRSPTRR